MAEDFALYSVASGLSCRVLGGRVLVCTRIYAAVLPDPHVFHHRFFHRYLSHKTFQTSRPVQFLFVLIGTMSAQRGPLWWAAHHRYHHRYTDTLQDPHSSTHGFWYSHVGWFLNEYHFATRKEVIKDWLKYPELIWLDRFSLIVVLLTAGGIYAFGEWLAITWPQLGTSGLQLLVWGFVISTVLLIHATLCINSLAHHYGSRDFDTEDQSRNNNTKSKKIGRIIF